MKQVKLNILNLFRDLFLKKIPAKSEVYEKTSVASEEPAQSTPIIASRPKISQIRSNPYSKVYSLHNTLDHLKKKLGENKDESIVKADEENVPANSSLDKSVSNDFKEIARYFMANLKSLEAANPNKNADDLLEIAKTEYRHQQDTKSIRNCKKVSSDI